MTTETKINNDLKSLIIHTNDSVKGYEKAADRVRDESATLASQFEAHATRRSGFAERLKTSCGDADNAPERGSAEGSTHRALISVKDMFSSNEKDAIIKEAIRGEEKLDDYIQDKFQKADEFDSHTIEVIRELRADVQDSIRDLRLNIA